MAEGIEGIQQAVRLVTQAVLQDTKKNYREASRCYKEAIRSFHEVYNTGSYSPALLDFVHTKLTQYESRLREIDFYLLQQTDLTKLLKDLDVSSCSDDSCGSSVSSSSTTTRQLYKNPLLVVALDFLRRGKKADERRNYRLALSCYENGLSQLYDLINNKVLTPRQQASAQEKCLMYYERIQQIRSSVEEGKCIRDRSFDISCLSINSLSESPHPATETDNLLQMEEVQSCCSNLGSRQSLNQSFEEQQHSPVKSLDPTTVHDIDEGVELNRTHETIHASLPDLFRVQDVGICRSTHSLYPNCEIRRPPTSMSGISVEKPRYARTVPLADMRQELCLSTGSIVSCASAASSKHKLDSDRIVDHVDTVESELVNLYASTKLNKEDDTGSDSGYSDPSPDGRDGKSPASSAADDDRKSPFSDISEPGLAEAAEIFPNVIIQNERRSTGSSLSCPPRRQFSRQRSVFQNPEKDILTSQVSRDNLAVLSMDSVDAGPPATAAIAAGYRPVSAGAIALPLPATAAAAAAVRPEVYGRHPRNEIIPNRASAGRNNEEKRDGCFYVVAALDFCWCL